MLFSELDGLDQPAYSHDDDDDDDDDNAPYSLDIMMMVVVVVHCDGVCWACGRKLNDDV